MNETPRQPTSGWIGRPTPLSAPLPLALAMAAALLAVTARLAPAQPPQAPRGQGATNQAVSNQSMWPSPTAADWAKPVLVKWQRSWEDAVAVARETGKPILICINMDGEVASEHYAGIRYRSPEHAAQLEPYVCVIASVYRHTPRDHDDDGTRIECPRFGTVTCGEHIAIEPFLFEKYMDGRRISPRHIMVELDGSEVYDVYHTWDTQSVFNQWREGIEDREIEPRSIVRGDRPIEQRVDSRHVADREAVEQAYREGNREIREKLLAAAGENPDAASVELLRQAVFGLDPELADRAREVLAKTGSEDAVDLIADALRAPMDEGDREELVGALARIGRTSSSPRARWLSTMHQGLGSGKATVDAGRWTAALRSGVSAAGSREGSAGSAAGAAGGGPTGQEYPSPSEAADADWTELQAKLEAAEVGGGVGVELAGSGNGSGPGSRDGSGDSGAPAPTAESLLEVAETALALAREIDEEGGVSDSGEILTADPGTARRIARSRYAEARRAAEQALELGAEGWRPHAVVALSSYYLGDTEAAFDAAEIAAGEIPPGVTDWNSMAVLTVFAEGRFRTIKKAVEAGEDWDPKYLSDVHSAYSVLLAHPMGSAGQVVWHYDFLAWLGGRRYASRVVSEGIERYPASPQLHERLRQSMLEFRGPEALEARYEAMLEDAAGDDGSGAASLRWFAGLASFTAAEAHRRARQPGEAEAAYARSIEHYDRAIAADASLAPSANFNVALALAGRARLAIESNELDAALRDVLASYERAPEAAGTLDGMNVTPASTGQLLLARLEEAGRTDDASKLRAALDSLDPEDLLEPYVR